MSKRSWIWDWCSPCQGCGKISTLDPGNASLDKECYEYKKDYNTLRSLTVYQNIQPKYLWYNNIPPPIMYFARKIVIVQSKTCSDSYCTKMGPIWKNTRYYHFISFTTSSPGYLLRWCDQLEIASTLRSRKASLKWCASMNDAQLCTRVHMIRVLS